MCSYLEVAHELDHEDSAERGPGLVSMAGRLERGGVVGFGAIRHCKNCLERIAHAVKLQGKHLLRRNVILRCADP